MQRQPADNRTDIAVTDLAHRRHHRLDRYNAIYPGDNGRCVVDRCVAIPLVPDRVDDHEVTFDGDTRQVHSRANGSVPDDGSGEDKHAGVVADGNGELDIGTVEQVQNEEARTAEQVERRLDEKQNVDWVALWLLLQDRKSVV